MVTTPRLTYEDYADLEGDERYELLDTDGLYQSRPTTPRTRRSASG